MPFSVQHPPGYFGELLNALVDLTTPSGTVVTLLPVWEAYIYIYIYSKMSCFATNMYAIKSLNEYIMNS